MRDASTTISGYASCACGTGAGILAAHTGCFLMPAAAAAGLAASGVAGLAVSFSLAAGSYGLWHKLRGPKAARGERLKVTVGIAGGALLILGTHFSQAHDSARWLESLPQQQREDIVAAAKTSGLGIRKYAEIMCGSRNATP